MQEGFSAWRGARPYVATVVGVGIFGLPFAFAAAGWAVGALSLIVVAAMQLVMLMCYSQLILSRKNHDRYVAVMKRELGFRGQALGALAFFGTLYGAMVAYVVAGSEFAHDVLSPLIGGGEAIYGLAFGAIVSLLVFGGLGMVSWLQKYLVPLFFIITLALAIIVIPHFDIGNILALNWERSALPLSVVIFAMSGVSALPEMRDVLGKQQRVLPRSIALGTFAVACLYLLFTLAIVGVTGAMTTGRGVDGLSIIASPFAVIGMTLGILTTFTAFVTTGAAVLDTWYYDFHRSHVQSWLLTIVPPLFLVAFGTHDLIRILSTTGGLLTTTMSALILVAYERAKFAADLPKRSLTIPQPVIALVFVAYVAVFVWTLLGLIA